MTRTLIAVLVAGVIGLGLWLWTRTPESRRSGRPTANVADDARTPTLAEPGPAMRLSGVVVDGGGDAVPDARVRLFASGEQNTTTDEQGRFEFREVPSGTHRVTATRRVWGFAPPAGSTEAKAGDSGVRIVLNADFPDEPVRIEIRAFTPTGHPATGGLVGLIGVPSYDRPPLEDGKAVLHMGKYASAGWRLPLLVVWWAKDEHGNQLAPHAWRGLPFKSATYEVQLTAGRTITGKITRGGTPWKGRIRIRGSQSFWTEVDTDAQGDYTCTGLPQGKLVVGFFPTDRRIGEIAPDTDVGNFDLPERQSIEVHVRYPSGFVCESLKGVLVEEASWGAWKMPDRFYRRPLTLRGLLPGDQHELYVLAKGQEGRTAIGSVGFRVDKPTVQIDLVEARAIEGVVVDEKGRPPGSGIVRFRTVFGLQTDDQLEDLADLREEHVGIDGECTFVIEAVARNDGLVLASTSDFMSRWTPVEVGKIARIVAKPVTVVEGHLTGGSGTDLSDWAIEAWDAKKVLGAHLPLSRMGRVGADGYFRLKVPRDTVVRIYARTRSRGDGFAMSDSVTAGTTGLKLPIKAAGVLAGHVRDKAGEGLRNAVVSIVGDWGWRAVWTKNGGVFRCADLPKGRYQVRAFHLRQEGAAIDVDTGTLDLDLRVPR